MVWIWLAFAPLAAFGETAPASQKAVLVTGASTGIGRAITERLAKHGYFVYAGARKEADLKALSSIANVQGVRLDVTSDDDIAAAVEIVRQGGRGLYGLVNNAGVATWGPLLATPPKEFDVLMAVNVYGPYRVTRAFAPLITASKGRITTISSLDGVMVPRAKIGVYCMSKHAVEGFVDALALELEPLGVTVNVVEPGPYNTQINHNMALRNGDPDTGDRSELKPPGEVAAAVERALFESRPQHRYMVVPEAKWAQLTIRKQLEQLVQLNEGQPYTYDRATLVRMLDDALAHARPKAP
jgi:NAD(P)-dependent dehydrogenase (short-subunit alcohol dehydrogenase family)